MPRYLLKKSVSLFRTRRGESLIEVMIAIGMLMLIGGPASALFLSSSRTVTLNRNELLASSQANEGIEMLINMRDTNLLRFSSKKEECWNVMPEVVAVATCQDGARIAGELDDDTPHSYRLAVNVNPILPNFLDSRLEPMPPLSDTLGEDGDEVYRLWLDEDAGPACGEPALPGCHTHFVDDTHLYTHDAMRGHPTPLYREVMTQNLDYNDDQIADAILVRVRVGYVDGARTRFVTRSTKLTQR